MISLAYSPAVKTDPQSSVNKAAGQPTVYHKCCWWSAHSVNTFFILHVIMQIFYYYS